ncbi:hypothetical protein [Brevibacillus sp. SYSU BS000544]|uniref:hypothetical protein n=1 Tax=Brevibacillus sp. SYSU BS000544 TaxID=3416443 RepID=UPI003CE52FFF
MDNVRQRFQQILEKFGCLDFHVKFEFGDYSNSIISKDHLHEPQLVSALDLSLPDVEKDPEAPNWTMFTNEFLHFQMNFTAIDEILDWIEREYGWSNVYPSSIFASQLR